MQQQVAATPQIIPMEAISVLPDFNPRKHFNDNDFNRLLISIRDNGLITPISVRRLDEGQYALVAGERRFRALKALKEMDVPALVLENCDDDTARRLALLENTDRANLSIPEEAYAAQKHVDAFDGDYQAAADSIGWSLSKLKCRLQLLHSTAAVLEALTTNAIALGHAELLSSLPTNQQDILLQRIIEGKVSVSTLKEQLEAFSISLSQAFFDTTDCKQCPHNSSQADLFGDKISADRCTNKTCFNDKTKLALQAHKTALADEYATLAFHTEKVEGSFIPLVATGSNGVGAEQIASGCAGCAFRGGLIEDRISATTGQVTGPICFQRTCHTEKKAAYQQSLVSVTTVAPQPTSPSLPAQTPKAAIAPQTNKVPTSVTVQYDAVVRRAVQANIATSPNWILAIAVYGQATLLTGRSNDLQTQLTDLGFKVTRSHNKAEVIAQLSKSDINLLKQALVKIPAILLQQDPDNQSLYDNLSRRELNARIAKSQNLDLTPFVRIDAQYLSAFTKSGIEAELHNSGFKAWMQGKDNGDKQYTALLAMKKDELVKTVLSAGFDFSNYLPAAIGKQMNATISGK